MKPGQSVIAASFNYLKGLINPGTLGYAPNRRATVLATQRFRNNYAGMGFREVAATCRTAAEVNWFLRPVVELRAAAHNAGFALVDPPELASGQGGVGGEPVAYPVGDVVADLMHEDLVTSNLICLFRKGGDLPAISVVDAERAEYRSVGGVETLHMSFSADPLVRNAKGAVKSAYIESLGEKMYRAMCRGGACTIVKGSDPHWNFCVLPGGKRRGCLTMPSMVSVLDDIDMVELAKVGDWNLLWKRKDVIRFWTKGYAVKSGPGAGVDSVNISKGHIKEIGEGAKEINGSHDIPKNHDVDASYLTISPDELEPKHLEAPIERLLHYGGTEAVALFGSFSQQNGVAPSLMRNARVRATLARGRAMRMLQMLFAEEEFSALGYRGREIKARWSQRPLHSIEELTKLVKETAGGIASPQTRREMLDFDDGLESARMEQSAQNWKGYVPPFEASQGLVAAAFPEIYPDAKPPQTGTGDPGRPPGAVEE